jgi:hypothetical protein
MCRHYPSEEDKEASWMRHRRKAIVFAIFSMVVTAPVAAIASGPGLSIKPPAWVLHGKYAPQIRKANFVSRIDNPYFPLKPGTAFRYRGLKEARAQIDEMVVTHRVKYVLGVRCTVVRDTVYQGGKALERTFDWYAQDKQRNVWYMGEDSLERKNGRFVRASDSWEGGVKGAKPGIIMRGDPRRGDVYRQEYYPPGGALDQAHVVGASATLRAPAGTFKRVLVTDEWSPVEPQIERKYYVAGIGEIKERVTAGGNEQFELIAVTHRRQR